MGVMMFWIGVAAISCGLGTIYGPSIGWITFGCIVTPLAFVVVLIEKDKS